MTEPVPSNSPALRLLGDPQRAEQKRRDSTSEVILQVGEKTFRTSIMTLTGESTYFALLFSGRWQTNPRDGPVFIDGDPDLFEHILRYLRREVFPIFWDNNKGFDFGLYAALLKESEYFGIDTLCQWIGKENYRKAIRVEYSMDVVEGEEKASSALNTRLCSSIDRTIYPNWVTKKEYRCPRDIFVHHGDPSRCGRACDKAKSDGEDLYVHVDVLRTLVWDKRVIFSYDACCE